MKLYYSPGACSMSVDIALREADRAFELERVDLKTHRTASGEDYTLINPKGYVPALQLDGPGSEILTEAQVVLQYVADLVPDLQLAPPAGTFARYRLQEWLSFVSSELHKQFGPLFLADTPAITQARARAKLGERFIYLDGHLYGRHYLMGETFTVADCYLFVMLRWCDRFGIDRQVWPNLEQYYLDVLDRPSVQAALVAEGLVETHRVRRTG
jgi:glutathione S-transferase